VLREVLAGVPLFAACSKRDLQIISRHMQVVALDPGTVLMREGEQGDAFYIILEGTATMESGGRKVGEASAGSHVGELALLDPAPRNATVVARTAMTVGVIDARSFSAIVRDVPALSVRLLRSLARRLRERDREVVSR
jgi:CRP-like cAMP-binding protein